MFVDEEAVCHGALTHGRGVWVPAFAGTTAGLAKPRLPNKKAGVAAGFRVFDPPFSIYAYA
jgi:hypothetical protein